MRFLVAIPVFNEEKYARGVLERVLAHAGNVLVVDDGSTDRTTEIVSEFPVDMIRHCVNRGYGQSLIDAFRWAHAEGYEWVLTMDCDEQHEPDEIPAFVERMRASDAARAAGQPATDIVSGSRYLLPTPLDDAPPADRRGVNAAITAELNQRLGLALTDSFCGFKAHRTAAMASLGLTETGYAFPMQMWVRSSAAGLVVEELPVTMIYNDPNRSFGEHLDDPAARLAHYRCVMHREILRASGALPASARAGLHATGRACGETPPRA
ncbi:MAG: glycosyltransferase family 2 protein [Phycisphaeraceae bacterium]|nr:MAG: glycosyltransferase family 2 protein [Phycisphaeraceae bacterium]